jgi:bifunctional non-homologous end joining protein LigD
MPIAWEELTPELHSDHFTVTNALARLSRLKKAPWAEMLTIRQTVTKTMFKRLDI